MAMIRRCSRGSWPALAAAGLALAACGCAAPMNREVTAKPNTRWAEAQLGVYLRLSQEHLASGELDRARAALAAYEHVADSRVQLSLARLDVEQGKYTTALKRLDFVSGPAAVSGVFFHLRGVAYEGLNQSLLSASAFAQSYAIEPDIATLVGWIDALVMAERGDEAEAALLRERTRFPGDAELSILAARLHARGGDHQGVIRELRHGVQAGLQSDEAPRRLAEAYAAVGRHHDAARVWQDLTERVSDPDERHEMESRLAERYVAAGDSRESQRVYRSLTARRPRDAAARLGLAVSSLAQGDAAEALRAAQACISLDPADAEARLVIALSYHRLNDRIRAIQVLSTLAVEGEFPDVVPELLADWLEN